MQTPLPEDAPPEVPLLVRIGSLAGTGTLAALLGAVPAATRVGPVAGGILSAWIALGASAILPLIAVVAFAQAAREGAKSVAGGDAPLVTWAAATWAMTTFLALAAWGALLRATTHHHGLAGVTFALGGLAIAAVLALLVRRMMQMARAAEPWWRAALVASVVLVLVGALFAVLIRVVRAGGTEVPPAAVIDLLAFTIAAGALSRQTFARVTWLAVSGFPIALGVLGLGWALLTREPSLLDAIRAHAPLLAPMAALARPR
jgi:choline-sulfatase